MDVRIGRKSACYLQRQKIGSAESNKGQLKNKPGQSKEEAVQVQEANESTGQFLRPRNRTCGGGLETLYVMSRRTARVMGYLIFC